MPLFYVKIRKNIDICNYLPIYYPAICRGWGTFSVPSILGERLRAICQELLKHKNDKSILQIMGSHIDVAKLKSSMQLFDQVSPNDIFNDVLIAYYKRDR